MKFPIAFISLTQLSLTDPAGTWQLVIYSSPLESINVKRCTEWRTLQGKLNDGSAMTNTNELESLAELGKSLRKDLNNDLSNELSKEAK